MTDPRIRLAAADGESLINTPDSGAPLARGGGSGDDGGMDDRIRQLELAMTELRGDVKAGFGDLRADINKAMLEGNRWTHGAVIGTLSIALIGVLGLLVTIWNSSKPVAPAQPPIIINIPGSLSGQAPSSATATGSLQTPPAVPAPTK